MAAEDLSSLLAAVKGKDRDDQYLLLSALYSLKAFEKPVTTRQVTDHLALHVPRKDLPVNSSDALRKATTLVRIAHKGSRLQWLLTEQGIASLKARSGLPLTSQATSTYATDVGIICALEQPEFDAVVDAAGGSSKWRSIGDARFPHVYRACDITTVRGKSLSVVGTTSTSMGLTAASIVTTQLVMQFQPRIVVMVGIAAGMRSSNMQFGDVLVADPSVDYNSGKVSRDKGIRDFLPDPYPLSLNPRLRALLQKYRGNHPVFGEIMSNWNGARPSSRNRLHLGPVGAADQVIDDPTRILEIQRNWRKLIGVEMETYAVYRACHEAPQPQPRYVSFKAVCDFAAEKTDSWQGYAAYCAAEFALRFIRSEWEDLWPKA